LNSVVISTHTITQQLTQHQPVLSNTGDSHAAVALILDSAASTDDPEIVFIERARVPNDPWSGHIAFPGGRREPGDQLPLDTAVRETEEEIGVDLSAGQLLGQLDDLTGRRSHHLVVSCFVFMMSSVGTFRQNHEVADVFTLPISRLLETKRQTEVQYEAWQGQVFPAIRLSDHEEPIVWGLTYRFLENFFALLGHHLPPS